MNNIILILALAILASTSTVDANECANSKGYRAGRRQVKKMWENRGSCSNIDGFDVAVRRMIQTRFRPSEDSTSYKHSYNQCAKRGARSMLEKYQQECDDDNEEPRQQSQTCDDFMLEICCDDTCVDEATDYTSGDEVREADVCKTKCFDELGGSQCEWFWRAEGCDRIEAERGSSRLDRNMHIHCMRPSPGRVSEEGHEAVCNDLDPNVVPYECEDDSKLCCTKSSRTKVTFDDKGWGECTKKQGQKRGGRGGWKDRNQGSIQCTKPRQWKIERDGHEEFCANTFGDKVVPYKCEDESKLCCADSSLTKVTFEEKEEWGECTKIEGQENERERDDEEDEEDDEDEEFDDEDEDEDFEEEDEEFDEEYDDDQEE